MSGFNLPENFTDNPEGRLRKKNKKKFVSSSATSPTEELVTSAPSTSIIMAKSLCEYSTSAVANVPVGPAVNIGIGNFELRTGLLTMV